MTIIEAINQRSKINGLYITRKAWNYPYGDGRGVSGPSIKLMPTNSPDRIVMVSASSQKTHRGWKPSMDDLTAEDWVTAF